MGRYTKGTIPTENTEASEILEEFEKLGIKEAEVTFYHRTNGIEVELNDTDDAKIEKFLSDKNFTRQGDKDIGGRV